MRTGLATVAVAVAVTAVVISSMGLTITTADLIGFALGWVVLARPWRATRAAPPHENGHRRELTDEELQLLLLDD